MNLYFLVIKNDALYQMSGLDLPSALFNFSSIGCVIVILKGQSYFIPCTYLKWKLM